jgi:hypothetical protein
LIISPSSASSTSADDDTDDGQLAGRGRSTLDVGSTRKNSKKNHSHSKRRFSVHNKITSSGDSACSSAGKVNGRTSFTRSRSPAVSRSSKLPSRMLSPSVAARHNRLPNIIRNLLPAAIQIHTRVIVPLTIIIDTRLAGECILLVASLLFIISKLPCGLMHASPPDASNWTLPRQLSFVSTQPIRPFILELYLLSAASFLYIMWAHTTSPSPLAPASSSPAVTSVPLQPPPVKLPEVREPRRHSTPLTAASRNNLGFIWMSVPKNYRCEIRILLGVRR